MRNKKEKERLPFNVTGNDSLNENDTSSSVTENESRFKALEKEIDDWCRKIENEDQ